MRLDSSTIRSAVLAVILCATLAASRQCEGTIMKPSRCEPDFSGQLTCDPCGIYPGMNISVINGTIPVGREIPSPYPMFWRHFTDPTLTNEWFQARIAGIEWKKSQVGQQGQAGTAYSYNDQLRVSENYTGIIEQMQKATLHFLSEWSGLPTDVFDQQPDWNILRYVGGHFSWHKDRVRYKNDLGHYGTLIAVPPLSFARFTGGTLRVIENQDSLLQFQPQENLWLFIVMPLGYVHTVDRVNGTRYSFTKPLFMKAGVQLPKTFPVQP